MTNPSPACNGFHSRITIRDVKERRVREGKLVAGVAAVGNSDMFKTTKIEKSKARDWEDFFSSESRDRYPATIKQALGKLKTPGIIGLGGGLPSSDYFPFSKISLQIVDQDLWGDGQDLSKRNGTHTATIGKHDAKSGLSEYDLSIALNYGQATGSPQMTRFITEHTELLFNPPYQDWDVCQTVGSTSALEQVLRLLCDRQRKDSVITDEFTFATALETIMPQGIKTFGVDADSDGIIPSRFDEILSTWDEHARGARKPHILYTIPTGQNPTGATQSPETRREIYSICQKHNILIIEDEPYYFLQMAPYQRKSQSSESSRTVEEFIDSLIPTYLSMDIDGRVIRMDSFSKVLVPGSRLGWITASKQIVQHYIRHAEVANQGPSGFSQVILWKLLDETWGHEGYLRWLMNLQKQYTQRRDVLVQACETYLPQDIVSWTPPSAGMFLWLEVDPSKHPDYLKRKLEDIEEEIYDLAIANGVLCARGSWFRTEPGAPSKSIHFRTTFASATEENMASGIQRLGQAIDTCFGRRK